MLSHFEYMVFHRSVFIIFDIIAYLRSMHSLHYSML